MNAEEVKVGGYQILSLLLLSINLIIAAMSHVLTRFYMYTPKFYCQETDALDVARSNRTYGCFAINGSTETRCPGQYVFETSRDYERSVASEWQLVCERENLLRAGSNVYFAGLLVGGLLAGFITDRIGRLPVLAICLYAQGTMAVALNVVQEYQLFLVFRGMQGFFVQGLETCTFLLCMELFPAKFRALIALIILSMRAFGIALLSGLSYAIPDWRILQLAVAVPTAITVLYMWIIPESPRWLLAKGKLTEAEMLLERIASYNSRCGLSKKNEDTEKVQKSDDREKPQKPRRKTRVANADAKCSTDVEKSFEESKNLLPSPESQSPTAQSSAEDKNTEKSNNIDLEDKNLPSELDIEEINRASLMVVDEKNASNSQIQNGTSPSYLLVSKEAFSETERSQKTQKKSSALFRFLESKYIGRTCLIMMSIWFTSSMAFHSLVSLSQGANRERHVSLTMAAGMQIVAFVLFFLLISTRCGRRWPLCISQLLVGIACLAIAALTSATSYELFWLAQVKATFVTIGRFANIGSFFILRIIVIELFPTISRGTGVALCIGAEMIGGLLTPFVSMLNSYVLELPRYLIGFICICTGLLTLTFPNTSLDVLPDSLEDARNVGQKNNVNENIDAKNSGVLREKLFSEDWVDAGNGIIVNFTENKDSE